MTDEAGDAPEPELIRDHVTFRPAGGAPVLPLDAAEDLVRHVRAAAKAHAQRIRARAHTSYSGAVTVRVYWHGGRFHTVGVKALEDGRLLARHNVADGRALSRLLHDWLAASDRFTDPSWRTRDQFRAGAPGQTTPS